jgi:hypothetical protein
MTKPKPELPRSWDATWEQFVENDRADLEAQIIVDAAINEALGALVKRAKNPK